MYTLLFHVGEVTKENKTPAGSSRLSHTTRISFSSVLFALDFYLYLFNFSRTEKGTWSVIKKDSYLGFSFMKFFSF